ncbi:MAG: divalent-cation tolerance protein CutA [Candidatus Bathyarchaeota archaeon]|nr:MAG: divalent-cation tolerance protein CutA [Candidatus Bathyarchaeota archaeon]
MSESIQVITTTSTRKNAEKIANVLVKNRLAACVQLIDPMASIYRWDDKIRRSSEVLCLVKTRRDLYKAVELSIHNNHIYKTPEILAIPAIECSEDYWKWILEATHKT